MTFPLLSLIVQQYHRVLLMLLPFNIAVGPLSLMLPSLSTVSSLLWDHCPLRGLYLDELDMLFFCPRLVEHGAGP